MKKTAILFLLAISIFLISISTTLAWLTNTYYIEDGITAGALSGYFGGGDGTETNPYIISAPRHLYNLAWLQYLGRLNKVDEGTGRITQYYFRLCGPSGASSSGVTIDAGGLVIPPIGTTEYPFVGHFDGNGCTIKNLTVSNYMSTSQNVGGIVERPLSVTTINEDATSIVGFFGVVGAIDETMKAKLAEEDPDVDARYRVNSVHDLFLDNLTVRTDTEESLIGLLAGYANGSIGNVGIGTSSIVVGDGVLPLTDFDPVEATQLISAFSLIGQCGEDILFWEDVFTQGWGDGNGTGAGWGGSINMLELRKRITYIVGSVGLTKKAVNQYGFHGRFSTNVKDTIAGEGENFYMPNSGRVISAVFLEGSIMPLSVEAKVFDNVQQAIQDENGVYLDTSQYYLDNITSNKEPVLSTNSAYIVGGGVDSATQYQNNSHINFLTMFVAGRTFSNAFQVGIYKSIGTSIDSAVLFPENNLQMLTKDVSGNTYVIEDKYNTNATTWFSANKSNYVYKSVDELGFEKYYKFSGDNDEGVRNTFVNGNKNAQYLHGIQFAPKIDISDNKPKAITTVDDVQLLGVERDGYEMVNGAINFSLAEAGIVTTIAGTYAQRGYTTDDVNTAYDGSAVVHSLFRIFKVTREGNKITNFEMINTVHKKLYTLAENEEEYVYNLQTEDVTRYQKVYDYDAMSQLTEVGAAYYFEIPLNAGEYAMGLTVDDKVNKNENVGACLLYLDIGANGSQSVEDKDDMVASHTIKGVTFVNMENLTYTEEFTDPVTNKTNKQVQSTIGYSVVAYEITLNEGITAHTGLEVSFQRAKKADGGKITYIRSGDIDKFTFKWTPQDASVQEGTAPANQVAYVTPRKREDTA